MSVQPTSENVIVSQSARAAPVVAASASTETKVIRIVISLSATYC